MFYFMMGLAGNNEYITESYYAADRMEPPGGEDP